MTEILTLITNAITLAKKLNDLKDKVKDAEFVSTLADLSLSLANIKLELAGVIDENVNLKQEIATLKSQLNKSTDIVFKNGYYYTQSGEGPFCTGCYDEKKQTIRLTQLPSGFDDIGKYQCPVCKQVY